MITQVHDVDLAPAESSPHTATRPTPTPSPARRSARLVGALLLALAVLVPLLRQTGVHSWDTIWGEDGWLYFQQAHDHGLRVLFQGYAGYLQLGPRLLAVPSVLVPIHQLALYFALTSAVVGAALAWFVYWATASWIDSRPVRVALASLVVVMPALGYENTANVTNSIWILLAVCPWALVSRAEDRRGVRVCSLVAVAAATATPLAAVFVPLAVGWALFRRRRSTWTVTAAFLVGLAVQFAVVLHTQDTRPHRAVRQLAKLPDIVGVKVFGQLLIGERGIRAVWDHRTMLAVVAPLVVLGALALTLPGLTRRRQMLAVALVAMALALFLVPAWGRGTNQVSLALTAHTMFGARQAGHYNPMSTRYAVAPVFLLASALALAFGSTRSVRRATARRWRVGFVIWVVAVSALGFSATNPRSLGPSWPANLDAAQRIHCTHQPPGTRVRIRLPNPSVNPPVVLTCRDLGS